MIARLLAALLACLALTLPVLGIHEAPLLALLTAPSLLLLPVESPSIIVAAATITTILYTPTPIQAASITATILAAAWSCAANGTEPLIEALKRLTTPRPSLRLAATGIAAETLILLASRQPPLAVALMATPIAVLATAAAPRKPPLHVAAAYILSIAAAPLTPAYALSLLIDTAPLVEDGEKPLAPAEAILAYKPPLRYAPRIRHKTKWWWLRLQPGTTYHHPHHGSINPHVTIIGSTGSGKSHAAALLSSKMAKEYRATILAIDPHGEYKELYKKYGLRVEVIDAAQHGLNPLMLLEGETPRRRARQIVELMKAQYPIGPLQATILENAIITAYIDKGLDPDTPYQGQETAWPTLNEAVRYIAEEAAAGRKSAETLNYYVTDFLEKLGAKTIPMEKIVESNVVIDLHRIGARGAKTLYVDTLLRILYHYYTSKGITTGIRKIIVVDEAHTFYPRARQQTETTLTRLVRELRKYGVAVIVVTQSPLDLEREVIDNTATILTLTLTEPRVLEYTAKLLAAYRVEDRVEAVKLILHELPRGYGILKTHGLPSPVIVRLMEKKR
ncbi:MAG: DUF87 domain-containing protein [Crenarchaeota archaeon]|nr:DUF87 domain-containing protein [Thermoproteota archaeon]